MIYDETVDVRISDLDMYGHVNSKHYVDFVSTSRLVFLERRFNVSIASVTERGIGFFLTQSLVNYKKPIHGLQKVRIKSHISEVKNDRILVVSYVISNHDETRIFSDGTLSFAVIDLKQKKAVALEDWMLEWFLEPAPENSTS